MFIFVKAKKSPKLGLRTVQIIHTIEFPGSSRYFRHQTRKQPLKSGYPKIGSMPGHGVPLDTCRNLQKYDPHNSTCTNPPLRKSPPLLLLMWLQSKFVLVWQDLELYLYMRVCFSSFLFIFRLSFKYFIVYKTLL